jgi:hypothetical protein
VPHIHTSCANRDATKGDALLAGFRAARNIIVMMDAADGSTSPGRNPLFLQAVIAGRMSPKARASFRGAAGADILPRGAREGTTSLCFTFVNLLFQVQYSDLCYGFNAFRPGSLACIDMHSTGFEVEALLTATIPGRQVTSPRCNYGIRAFTASAAPPDP